MWNDLAYRLRRNWQGSQPDFLAKSYVGRVPSVRRLGATSYVPREY
jgi:hypothetical protein